MKYKEDVWDLTELTNNKPIDTLFKEVESQLKVIENYKEKFTKDISTKDFNKLIDELEKYDILFSKIAQFIHLKFRENTADKEYIALKNRISQVGAEHSNRILWFHLNFVKFPKKDAEKLIESCQKANYDLKQMRLNKKYVLSDKEEKLINIKDSNGLSKLGSIYTILSGSFTFKWEDKELTIEEVRKYVKDTDPSKRKKAYDLIWEKYQDNNNIFGEIYTAILQDQFKEDVELRKYKEAISVRNTSNDIKDKTIETLLKVYEKNKHLFQDYFKLKAKALNMNKLKRYDVYAPITEKKVEIPFEEATEMVLKTFKEFSEEFYLLADSIFKNKHIHSPVKKGKDSGAFMWGIIPDLKPYVFLNYTKDYRDVSTLAHELGHAIHFMLASKHQSVFHVHSALPIAETASIFSELLLDEKLKQEKPEIKKQLLFAQLDDAYATIARQLEFIKFEIKAHELAKTHVSTDALNKMYLEMLKDHFGDSVEVSDNFQYEWSYIPHIFKTPFYCYAYAFGNLLSFAAYAHYKETGDNSKLKKMLEDGGSKPPRELVKELGFNIQSERFWQKGFNVIADMIKELKKL